MKYSYKGFVPYGTAEQFCIDQYIEDEYQGNRTEKLIADGIAVFVKYTDNIAALIFPKAKYNLKFAKC